MNIVELHDWAVVFCPLTTSQRLCGTAVGHPVDPSRHYLVTSSIRGRDGECVVTSSGTRYKLMEPKADYEELFPNCNVRLMNSLPEVT